MQIDSDLKVHKFLCEAQESSKRARNLMFLFIFTSVVAFISYWNSRESSWVTKRYEAITQAYKNFTIPDSYRLASDTLKIKIPDEGASTESELTDFLKGQNITTKTQIEDLKKIFISLNEDTYRIKVPILGVTFDINDLGFFGGLTMSFLMLIFWYALEREMDNLEIAFNVAKENNMQKLAYDYLTMSQVLTLPKSFSGENEFGQFWKSVPKVLYCFPAIAHGCITINDIITFFRAYSLNHSYTVSLTIIDIIFLAAIVILSAKCLKCSQKIDNLWHDRYIQIKEHTLLQTEEKTMD